MLLPYIFASHALFQSDSVLTIRGTADAGLDAHAVLCTADGRVLSRADRTVGGDGWFSLPLATPAASFDAYTIRLSCGDDVRVLDDILFGELWLASGQSNMEIGNGAMPEQEVMYDKAAGKRIRVYAVDYWQLSELANDPPFPYDPQPMMGGHWLGADDRQGLAGVSAAATAFAVALYDKLNQQSDVPVGFLNASWGGVPLLAFLDRRDIDADPAFADKLRRLHRYPDADGWNGPDRGCCCFQQTSACYNVKIAPLEGVRTRGILWYQGENETGSAELSANYADSLRFYHRTMKSRFAADPDRFPMISSLLYLWTYGAEGECYIGQLNHAFIRTAVEAPDSFMFVPCGDLMPSWAQHQCNHPIHPTHKYPLGARMAASALTNVYGMGGQPSPAVLRSVEPDGAVLRLRFTDCGTGLRIGDGPYRAPVPREGFRPVHCLYVAGADGRYLPAEARIVSPDTLEVRCEEIAAPVYAAYGCQSMEPGADLFAGDWPVAPFCNDTRREMRIGQKPWYDMNNTRQWAYKVSSDSWYDLFFHPVWRPVGMSEVCSDPAFCYETDMSLRVCGDDVPTGEAFGCFVTSYPYARLDFAGYAALEVSVFNAADVKAFLRLETAAGTEEYPLETVRGLGGGWCRMRAAFDRLPDGEVTRMTFLFRKDTDVYRFINMERVRLIPGKSTI